MKPAPFDYVRPSSVEEACRLVAEAGGGAQIIAGGQTLMPLLALRMSQPFVLVDIGAITELHGISRLGTATRIGPMTRQNTALADPLLARHLPVMVKALSHVGHHQTRNRGTIGGSLSFGEPAAEMPATAVALDATFELRSVRGLRRVAAADFYFGPYATALEQDEVLTAIDYPDWPAHSTTIFREVARRPGDFAMVGLVGMLESEGGQITRCGLAWLGMGPTPIRARQAEAQLIGQPQHSLNPGLIAEAAIADTQPFDDHHASADYRRTVGRRLFAAALGEALQWESAA